MSAISVTSSKTHTAQDGKGILITESAMKQLARLCQDKGSDQLLRVGVRSGGCSGMSYTMDFVAPETIESTDESSKDSSTDSVAKLDSDDLNK